MKNELQYKPMADNDDYQGIIYALICYIMWGVFPIFWKQLSDVPAVNVLANRIVWSFAFLFIFILFSRQRNIFFSYIQQPKLLLLLGLSGSIIALNWGIYIYAVETNHIVESGLGYYINPLINVLLGYLFLKERLTNLQKAAVSLAFIGVVFFTISYGKFPWISLILAISFGLYGLLKKKANLESMPALTIETMLVFPFAIGFLVYSSYQQNSSINIFDETFKRNILLIVSGIVTALPLYLFGKATQKISLLTLGFIQYLSPTLQLLSGILLFNENFTFAHIICFLCVWAGLIIFMINIIREKRSNLYNTTQLQPETIYSNDRKY